VALKTVTSTSCDSARAVRRLKAEVQLARRITHPNVCRIYDLGSHAIERSSAELNFLVMEFVEGECLGKRLRQSGALPIELANSIAKQLLLGLRAAHHAGILHRDFKSENVMLRSDAEGIVPVILDFGLAKTLNETGHFATTQNQNQAMIGTIGYMAPEQIEGEPLSTASDIYAFGVVWFEMLTGRLPFEGSSPAASAIARLHRPAEAPSSVNPKVPKWLDQIVLHCLTRERSLRFNTADQVLETLEFANSTPSQQPPPSSLRKLRHWPVVALLAASVLFGYVLFPARPERAIATKTRILAALPMAKLQLSPIKVQVPTPPTVSAPKSRPNLKPQLKPTAPAPSTSATPHEVAKPRKLPDWLPLTTNNNVPDAGKAD
ncbi:MAG TPA: serine/threonine-protein kinase, partial [Polyangiaceae bacterium]|nr:serine/threonine-protein kinase [Polyangiaceae bacterium]